MRAALRTTQRNSHGGRLGTALAAVLAACASPPEATPAAPGASRHELVVLGIAQDGGVPHFGCRKACCEAARRDGTILDPACVAVVDQAQGKALLVEATPGIERQVARLGVPIAAVLITHAHIGHYLGLAQFGREVAATRELPVQGSPRLCAFLRAHGPWRQLVELAQIRLEEFAPGATFAPMPGLEVTAIPVPHRDEYSDTMAFKIRGAARAVLFVPDVDRWDKEPGLLARLVEGVDVAYVDGTFWDGSELPGRDLREIPHPLMTDTMRRLADLARERPGAVRFIHLNHTNPALRDAALRAQIEAAGFRIAEVGERVGL
jgi:pyrroloquinoline quinone biosynthesis protein B